MLSVFQSERRLFGLSFEANGPAILIHIWEPCIDAPCHLFGEYSVVPRLLDEWHLGIFENDLRKSFGFNNAWRFVDSAHGYCVVRVPLRDASIATALTFEVFFDVLTFYAVSVQESLSGRVAGDENRSQLMSLESHVSNRGSWLSTPLGGEFAPVLVDWIEGKYGQGIRRFESVEWAMWLAWNASSAYQVEHKPDAPHPYAPCRSEVGEGGAVFLACPGNACEVFTERCGIRAVGEGRSVHCHNLDTTTQQLCFLAGLAALHELAARDVDTRPPP